MSKKIAELSFDLQSGLAAFDVPDYDDLKTVGMAATLAIHIKGLGEIDYGVLRGVSGYYMGIPSTALDTVLRILKEVGHVELVENGRKITAVIPNIPIFDEVYSGIGEYIKSECSFNEHEETVLAILSSLQDAPANHDALLTSSGADKNVFKRTLEIGETSGLISSHLARGRNILISPIYFADNLDGLADAAVAAGASNLKSTLKHLKGNQGWPLSIALAEGRIGTVNLNPVERSLVEKLSAEGMIKPPTIKFGSKSESFIFTPRPGGARLNAANREIYERAMALIAAVRKGQLLPDQYQIKYPLKILEALRDKGFLGSNSEAGTQYHNLVVLRVGTLKPGARGMQFHLLKTDENKEALRLAIKLLSTGSLSGMEVNKDARLALTKDETYIQSLISAREIKAKPKLIRNEEADYEYQQLLLKL
ncbi:hypothetical protein ELH70_15140 [Rhizobium ruizarguesonis]|uniref:hypothetical protein n=1 Tax=Rhizobium ruizarguesonis TaxID=2081791 RepID=UPI00103272F7|nr:hypothetical protein [Rhizobium ruizarguesonis]TAZ73897.1 hypothetical protein ELH70_15140 [Rhizobium ruizarguesonis]TBA00499.1 hypothetical protein ELH69_14320 [Rhizobium ruizarguesonis]